MYPPQFPSTSFSPPPSSSPQGLPIEQTNAFAPPPFPSGGGLADGSAYPSWNLSTMNPPSGSRLEPTPQEVEYFMNLYRFLDPQGSGAVDAATGAEFLQKSGLPREILHEIWRLADFNNTGFLDLESFFVACRLVAHAQNGQMPSDSFIMIQPISLPNFEYTPPYMAPSEASFLDTTGTGLAESGLGSMMDPSAAGFAMPSVGESTWAETLGLSSLPSTPPGHSTWMLPEEDRQKYLTLFQRTDTNADGFAEGMEAGDVLARSQLPSEELAHIWTLSDRDQDGRLTCNEFCVAMHLVTKRKKGTPLPSLLPPELESLFIASATSALPPPAFPSTASTTSGFPPQDLSDTNLTAFGDGKEPVDSPAFGGGFSLAPPEEKEKKKKGKSRKKDAEKERKTDEETFGDKVRDATIVAPLSKESELKDKLEQEWLDGKPWKADKGLKGRKYHSDEERSPRELLAVEKLRNGQVDSTTLMESLLESDRQLKRMIQNSVDRHVEDRNILTDITDALRKELVEEKVELERQLDRKKDFERQSRQLREELEALKEERRKVDTEKIAAGRDLKHYQEDIAFLRLQITDMQRDIELLQENNGMLEAAARSSEQQTKQLEHARKNVLTSLKLERELLQKEEREVAEMQNTLSRMRREKEDAQSRLALLQETVRQADQDRCMLLSAVETERSRLSQVRGERLAQSEEKLRLARDMTAIAQQQWMQTGLKPPSGQFMSLPERNSTAICEPLGTQTALPAFASTVAGGYSLRDAKGVPSTAPTLTSALDEEDKKRGLATVSGASPPSHWTAFGGTATGKSTADRMFGSRKEQRGVEKILLERGLMGSRSADEAFRQDNEVSHIGSRKDNAHFGRTQDSPDHELSSSAPSRKSPSRDKTKSKKYKKSKETDETKNSSDMGTWPSFAPDG